VDWTADKLKDFKVAVVGTVGSTFVLGEGVHTGPLAK
jgi:hypothetical protein